MNINKTIYANQDGIALIENGQPKEIGGITDEMELELEDGTLTWVYCVFFNLVSNVKSTDFFLLSVAYRKLAMHSLAKNTE